MGRSLAQFFLQGAAPEAVLGRVHAFGSGENLRVADSSASHITMKEGNEWVAGKKTLRVSAWPAEGGANIQVEVWWEGVPWGEMNADPRPFAGRLVRKDLWKTANRLLGALGVVNPEAVLRHY